VKSLIQDAVKMALHCKRTKLTTQDIDYTLKMNNYEVRLTTATQSESMYYFF